MAETSICVHVGPEEPFNPRDLTDEEQTEMNGAVIDAGDLGADQFIKFEPGDQMPGGIRGQYWTRARWERVDNGCGGIVDLGADFAALVRANPHMVDVIECPGVPSQNEGEDAHHVCGGVFPACEFVWQGTTDRVAPRF